MGRIIAIKGGGDWTDASVEFVEVKDATDLESCYSQYRKWYERTYVPLLRVGVKPVYYSFPEWLVMRGLANITDKVEEFYEL